MYSYDTLVEALDDLGKRGYTYDFNLRNNSIYCEELDEAFDAEKFDVIEYYRFEGASDPSDLSEVYAIKSTSGVKGILTDGYGISSELSEELILKLRFRP